VTAPKRIQRKRTKGWRMPEGAVYVGRPSRWGNPWNYGRSLVGRSTAVHKFRVSVMRGEGNVAWPGEIRLGLHGQDLACWCPLDQPCHADVLLDIANTPTEQEPS